MSDLSLLIEKLTELIDSNSSDQYIQLQNKELWTADDISKYLDYDKAYIQRSIVTISNFPNPVQIETKAGNLTQKRWISKEVRQWVKNQKTSQYKNW